MYTYERATTTVSLSVMGKGSCFDGEETEPEIFVSCQSLFPLLFFVNAGFECVFGEWGMLLTLVAIDCNEFVFIC